MRENRQAAMTGSSSSVHVAATGSLFFPHSYAYTLFTGTGRGDPVIGSVRLETPGPGIHAMNPICPGTRTPCGLKGDKPAVRDTIWKILISSS